MNESSSIEVSTRSILRRKHIQTQCGFSICIVHICHLQYLEFTILIKPQLLILLLFCSQGTCSRNWPKPWHHNNQNHEIQTHFSFGVKNKFFTQNLNLLKWGLWAMYMDDDSGERSKVKWFYLLRRKKGQNMIA